MHTLLDCPVALLVEFRFTLSPSFVGTNAYRKVLDYPTAYYIYFKTRMWRMKTTACLTPWSPAPSGYNEEGIRSVGQGRDPGSAF